jgi:hypothetical protein
MSAERRTLPKRGLAFAAAALGAMVLAVSAVGASTAARHAAAVHRSAVSQVAFRGAMDKLWEEHVAWTRMAIVSFAAGLPNLPATETRLLRNQVDIGNAIKPFYGTAAGAKLTALLKTHILQAVAVLKAAKAGNAAQLNAVTKAWFANAHQIASFLTKANPQSWPLSATTQMMDTHLKLTTQEAVDELHGHWAASTRDYDKVEAEILMMAHTLSNGIITQFPDRFSA